MSGFADLPRELRDIIYEMYIVDMIRQQPARGQSALITKAPILVCHKQFGREAALTLRAILHSRIEVVALKMRRLQSIISVYSMILRKVCRLDWRAVEYVMMLKSAERRRLESREGQLVGWLDDVKGLRLGLYGEKGVEW